jgi:hypothetical protein
MPDIPDILGYITGGERCAVGPVQVALAGRPAVIRAGRPLELVVIVQNMVDAPVEVKLALHLPKNFAAPKPQIIIGLGAGEVGYASLPAAARTGTPDGDVKIGVEIESSNPGKTPRLREPAPTTLVTPTALPPATRDDIEALTGLAYVVAKRMGRSIVDVPLTLSEQGTWATMQPQPQWYTLWTMGDLTDEAALLARYAEPFKLKVIPQLRRQFSMKPLGQMTQKRFADAGYPLKTVETLMITKMLTLILEYAAPTITRHSQLEAGIYNLEPLLTGAGTLSAAPRWFRGFLHTLGRHESALTQAVIALNRLHYDDLLRDTIDLAFALVETHTGENVGSDAEMAAYREHIIAALQTNDQLKFAYVYMPLVLGGMTINERVTLENENFIESMRQMWTVLDERRAECDDDTLPIIGLGEQMVERALQSYGFRRSSL